MVSGSKNLYDRLGLGGAWRDGYVANGKFNLDSEKFKLIQRYIENSWEDYIYHPIGPSNTMPAAHSNSDLQNLVPSDASFVEEDDVPKSRVVRVSVDATDATSQSLSGE